MSAARQHDAGVAAGGDVSVEVFDQRRTVCQHGTSVEVTSVVPSARASKCADNEPPNGSAR